MHGGRLTTVVVLHLILFVGGVAACGGSTAPAPGTCAAASTPAEAVVTFVWAARPDTMRVLVRGSASVRTACAFLAGESRANIPSGDIVAGGAPTDPALPFHYVPETVRLTETAIELCDSGLLRTQAQLEAYFRGTGSDLSGRAPYCPWTVRPVRVE